MSQEFRDILGRVAPAETPETVENMARELEAIVRLLALTLRDLGDADAQRAILVHLNGATLARLANGTNQAPFTKLTPEQLAWARNQFTEEEILAGLREFRETGGLELKDFIQEIDDILAPRE